jgi:hypothetical protein
MDPTTLTYIMTGAILVAAAAIVLQTVILIAMYQASRAMRKQITPLIGKMEPLIENTQTLVAEVREQVGEVASRTSAILELSLKQLVRVDNILADAASRTRVQMDRVELVLEDTINRIQETTALLQNGILLPLRQINGLTVGILSALSVLFGKRRTTIEQATHDEEMFI